MLLSTSSGVSRLGSIGSTFKSCTQEAVKRSEADTIIETNIVVIFFIFQISLI